MVQNWATSRWALPHILDSLKVTVTYTLSGGCQVALADSMSWCHVDLSKAHRLAVAKPKLSGRRSSSTFLNQDSIGLLVLRLQSLGRLRMQAWRAREWSWMVSARQKWPKKEQRSGWPVRDRTTSLEPLPLVDKNQKQIYVVFCKNCALFSFKFHVIVGPMGCFFLTTSLSYRSRVTC